MNLRASRSSSCRKLVEESISNHPSHHVQKTGVHRVEIDSRPSRRTTGRPPRSHNEHPSTRTHTTEHPESFHLAVLGSVKIQPPSLLPLLSVCLSVCCAIHLCIPSTSLGLGCGKSRTWTSRDRTGTTSEGSTSARGWCSSPGSLPPCSSSSWERCGTVWDRVDVRTVFVRAVEIPY